MSGKIKPNVRQRFSVMNVPDEKVQYIMRGASIVLVNSVAQQKQPLIPLLES